MASPWLDVPLDDYEGHMASPAVGQAQLLSDLLADALAAFAPASIAVVGCSGGNGFERIPPAVTTRVVGIDINPAYLERARSRFGGRFSTLELFAADIERTPLAIEPVDLVFAGLVLEYVDPMIALERMRRLIAPSGVLATVIQLPDPDHAPVTPTPFTTLAALAPVMRLLTPGQLRDHAAAAGFAETDSRRVVARGGKAFQAQVFRPVP